MKLALTLLLLLCPVLSWAAATPATLPQVTVDTSTYPVVTGTVRCVPAAVSWTVPTTGCITHYATIQLAIDAAVAGDEIRIDPAWTETSATIAKIILPTSAARTSYILIRTANYASLPARGTRINPTTHAAHMPKFVASGVVAALASNINANHYWFTGIEFVAGTGSAGIVEIGLNEAQAGGGSTHPNPEIEADLPDHIVFDRVYVHGALSTSSIAQAGFKVLCTYCSIEDSWIGRIHRSGHTQGIGIWAGSGHRIHNNYIDAISQNLFFGCFQRAFMTCTAGWPETPRDITVTHNHIRKDQAYLDDPVWNGCCAQWSSLIEWKSGNRVLVEGNIIEKTNTMDPFHSDWAILIKAENNRPAVCDPGILCNGPETQIYADSSDLTIRYNIIRHVGNFLTSAYSQNWCCYYQVPPQRQTIHDNLVYDLGTPGGTTGEAQMAGVFGPLGQAYDNGFGANVMVVTAVKDLIFRHNTVVQGRDVYAGYQSFLTWKQPKASLPGPYSVIENLEVTDNILPFMPYGTAWNNDNDTPGSPDGIPGSYAGLTTSTNHHNLTYIAGQAQTQGQWPPTTNPYPNHPAAGSNNNIYEIHNNFDVGFTNNANMVNTTNPLDFALASGNGRGNASDGLDRGANMALVVSKTTGVVEGTPAGATVPVTVTIPAGRQLTIGSGTTLRLGVTQ